MMRGKVRLPINRLGSATLALAIAAATMPAARVQAAAAPAAYANFRVSVYVTVGDVHALADPATFAREWARVSTQVHIDKVYIEAYRDNDFATDAELDAVKHAFAAKGVETWGGITLAAGGKNGQFATFDYENPADRAVCARAAALAARHFDAVILDDFFFYNSKSDADIAAKGTRSWTAYRIDKMHEAARDLVLGPARAANPRVRVIIKYPNWYEHFAGLGFDLDQGPRLFDGIHTGTETRDPVITDQLLQQYESYEVIRYFDNIAPGRNGGGWVDTYDTRYADRYAEQLWDTLFAKAREITLFNWHAMADPGPATAGVRPWAADQTSFDWNGVQRAWTGPGPAGWGLAAGYALRTIDSVLGGLGHPVGTASYRPYAATGEDFLHNYLGNIGIPIELSPVYPADARTILLTEAAAADPAIVDRIKASLRNGATVVVTSGLVQALANRGFGAIAEWMPTGHDVTVDRYVVGSGAGAGTIVDDGTPRPAIQIPEIRFETNDSWAVVRGVRGEKSYPLILTNDYSRGTIVMLTIPTNPSDLYHLPPTVLDAMRRYAGQGLPARLVEADAHVALFTYDNGGLVVESFRDTPTSVTIALAKGRGLTELPGGGTITPLSPVPGAAGAIAATDTGTVPDHNRPIAAAGSAPARFVLSLPPHSFRAYRVVP